MKLDWKISHERAAISAGYMDYIISHFNAEEISELTTKFETTCSSMPGFNSVKTSDDLYSDLATLTAWFGFMEMELHNKI